MPDNPKFELVEFNARAMFKKAQIIVSLLADNSHPANEETFFCLVYLMVCSWSGKGLTPEQMIFNLAQMVGGSLEMMGDDKSPDTEHFVAHTKPTM